MIVRNEAAVILRCLSSVRPFISHWAIVDTGSTDQTRALIRRALDKLPGKLVTRHWTNDFSIHRNQANTLAIKVMGTDQGFLFFIDADETLVLTDRTQFLRLLARRTTISWWAVHGDWCFRKLGIVRADVAGEWKGARHEQLQLRSSSKLTNQVQPWAHLLYGDDGNRRKNVNYSVEDVAALLQDHTGEMPVDFRSRFFLGRTYETIGDFHRAAKCYQLALAVEPVVLDDRWQALWGLARTQLVSDRAAAAHMLHKASVLAPTRAEPFVELASLARQARIYGHAVTLARAALNCNEPTNTSMYDNSAYGWRAVDELALSAVAVNDADSIGAALDRYKLLIKLKAVPNTELLRIEKNIRVLHKVSQRAVTKEN